MQIVTLALFLLSLVFGLITGVQMFLVSGCAQLYLLGDAQICGDTLDKLRDFLATFIGSVARYDLADHCKDELLLTCDLMASKMETAGIFTTIGSLLASVLTLQLIIESASLHERAVNRQKLENAMREREVILSPSSATPTRKEVTDSQKEVTDSPARCCIS
jgi:hypothetical protein